MKKWEIKVIVFMLYLKMQHLRRSEKIQVTHIIRPYHGFFPNYFCITTFRSDNMYLEYTLWYLLRMIHIPVG